VDLPQIRQGRFLLTRAKPTEIMGLVFAALLRSYEIVRANFIKGKLAGWKGIIITAVG
jgi:hypothetical protein